MISLAISAMLLTAVAAAFSASSEAIEINDQFFRASQAARVSMNQILTEIRRANAVQVPANNKSLSMITFDNKDRTYSFDSAAQKLKLITNDILDSDSGPEGLLNHPVLASAVPGNAHTTVSGSIDSNCSDFPLGCQLKIRNRPLAEMSSTFLSSGDSITTSVVPEPSARLR